MLFLFSNYVLSLHTNFITFGNLKTIKEPSKLIIELVQVQWDKPNVKRNRNAICISIIYNLVIYFLVGQTNSIHSYIIRNIHIQIKYINKAAKYTLNLYIIQKLNHWNDP